MGVISNIDFSLMSFMYKTSSLFNDPSKLLDEFDINNGHIVIDYGCGPGRYIIKASTLVGETGKVYAVDNHKLAKKSIEKMILKENLRNVIPVLANGYSSEIKSDAADLIYALDMFHQIKHPQPFLEELNRLVKNTGMLIIDDGHQPREKTREKILNSGCWEILEEKESYLKCKPTRK